MGIFTMTRVKHNYNPKFTREQLLPILYQQTVQVGLLLQQLEDAYMLLEQANVRINQLEEVRNVGGYREDSKKVEENASEEEVDREEEDNNTKVKDSVTVVIGDLLTKSLDIKGLEAASNSRVVLAKAYCSVKDWMGARFPAKNHEDVL